MVKKKIITVSFDYDNDNSYKRVADVLCFSARVHCPDAEMKDLRVNAPPKIDRKQGIESNSYKLYLWVDELNNSIGQEVILMDCDMCLTGNLFDAFNRYDFDIAYTKRRSNRLPLNGGVIFVRVNDRSLQWFEELKFVNNKMYNDIPFHEVWRKKYAGINQAAMGYLIENYKGKIKVVGLKCQEWNCVEWKLFDEKTKVIHVKDSLMDCVLGTKPYHDRFGQCVDVWKDYEKRMRRSKHGNK